MRQPVGAGERRRHRRAAFPVHAVLFRGEDAIGRFRVENLSAGGALVVGPHEVSIDETVRVLLPRAGGEPLVLLARVLRTTLTPPSDVSVGLLFDHRTPFSEDAIVDLMPAERSRPSQPAVLVVVDSDSMASRLSRTVGDVGRRPVVVSTPLDAVRVLEDPNDDVTAVVLDVTVSDAAGLELLGFLREAHPAVRRVLVAESIRPSAVDLLQASASIDAVIHAEFDERELREALAL